MTSSAAIDVLILAAGGLAGGTATPTLLASTLESLGRATGSGSGAIFERDGATGELRIVASLGLDEDGAAGLTAAVRNPAHAVARTAASGEAGFDVLPGNPGGPRLRTHLPLVLGLDVASEVIGVLALAHDEPIDPELRPTLQAAADLAAVAIDRDRRR
jgi:GAF domain-containing protein